MIQTNTPAESASNAPAEIAAHAATNAPAEAAANAATEIEANAATSALVRRRELREGMTGNELFTRTAPLVLEIGFGDGRYLTWLSRNYPDWNLLGVEVSLASVSRAFRRLLRENVTNGRVFKGNARFIVRDILAPGSLHRVYVNFPDPWPRRRHAYNRLLQAGFLALVADRLEPGGSLLLTTDHAEYFEFANEEARKTGLYDLIEGPPPPGTLETKYALKWQAEERPIYHVTLRLRQRLRQRPSEPAIGVPSRIEIEPMQHALLSGDLSAINETEKLIRRFETGTAIVTDSYRPLGKEGLLFMVVVEERDLHQELLVKAWTKSDGVFVGLQPFGDPMGTRGAREAVSAVVELLEGKGLTVLKRWI